MDPPTLIDFVLDSLEDLKYPGVEELFKDNQSKLELIQYSKLVAWLAVQLNQLLRLDSPVNAIEAGDSDAKAFNIELSTLLRELDSPFDAKQELEVVHFLCGELFAARIAAADKKLPNHESSSMDIVVDESETARALKQAITALGIGRPPSGVTEAQLFAKIIQRLKDKGNAEGIAKESALLFETGFNLTAEQWERLENFQKQLEADYSLRKRTLITRCDCTIKSFKWKPLTSGAADEERIDRIWDDFLQRVADQPKLSIADGLSLRDSDGPTLMNAVVSSHHEQCEIVAPALVGQANAGGQQRESLHKFLIGQVPDRGGRTSEQMAPQKESFSQQSQQRQGNRGGHRGGGNQRGGSRGHNNQSADGQYREQRDQRRGGRGGGGGGGRRDDFNQQPQFVDHHQPAQQHFDHRQQGNYQQGYSPYHQDPYAQQYDNYQGGYQRQYNGGGQGRGRGGRGGRGRQNYY